MARDPESQQELEGFPVLAQVQVDLDDVAGALQQLDEGTYGTCQTCGTPIDEERLSASPATRRCPECRPG
jgi:DnaK suppressor protein